MMVKVKHFLVLLNVGMAVVCLVALGVLQEKFSRPLYRRHFANYSLSEHKALGVLQMQDSATLPFSVLKPRNLTVFSQSTPQDLTKLHQLPETKLDDLSPSEQPYAGSTPRKTLKKILGHYTKVQEEPRQLGHINNLVVSPIFPRIVIYNRVPKCASATMLRICRSLSQINEFTFNDMKVKGLSHSELSQQKDLADWIFNRTFDVRHFFFKHIPYLNFTRFGYWEPTWINIVRHPVKRLISHYYYKGPLQTLDTCIETGVCHFKRGKEKTILQMCYFCGYSSNCSNASYGFK
ncbi:heparan sulfate 2-O-sulfotransferase 1-like, partial [Penaeus japonicus]|uniref:heparan sulfate 2-O-sulfotransferase 1-like n=1 Tax=Penaeus japonicus TaxID=27405 RepID=UPI001C70F11B